MEFPITQDKLNAFMADTLRNRNITLNTFLRHALVPHTEILEMLETDVQRTVFRNEKRSYLSYEVAKYTKVYKLFGDVDDDIHRVMTDYMRRFPTATYTIEVIQREDNAPVSCAVVIHFNLQLPSDQTSSRPQPE